jgi:hypothetical protein
MGDTFFYIFKNTKLTLIYILYNEKNQDKKSEKPLDSCLLNFVYKSK